MKSIIITGKQGSGKSTLAREIAKGYISYYETNIRDSLSNIPTESQVIILDSLTKKDISDFIILINKESLVFMPPYHIKKCVNISFNNRDISK